MSTEFENLCKLFAVVRDFVLSAGGDGDGWIISERYIELANLFGKYEKENYSWFTQRMDGDGKISFSCEQESISFVDSKELLPIWAGDIIVWIY